MTPCSKTLELALMASRIADILCLDVSDVPLALVYARLLEHPVRTEVVLRYAEDVSILDTVPMTSKLGLALWRPPCLVLLHDR